jgi:hypothetical protein
LHRSKLLSYHRRGCPRQRPTTRIPLERETL